jgi:hypothetical protein
MELLSGFDQQFKCNRRSPITTENTESSIANQHLAMGNETL